MDSFLHLEYGFTIRSFPILSIDISDKNIRNREKDFLPPAFSKNGPERAGSHPVELFFSDWPNLLRLSGFNPL